VINPSYGLKSSPNEVKVAFDFKINARRYTNPPTHFSVFLPPNLQSLNYVECYKITRNQHGFPIYHCKTEFVDVSQIQGLAIGSSDSFITDLYVKIKAVTEYHDSSKDPFVFIANYIPNITQQGGNTYYPIKPPQRIQRISSNTQISGQNINMSTHVIVDSEASLSLNNCITSPNQNSSDNVFYGFTIRDSGKLIINSGSFNLGNGFISAYGLDSKIEINNASNTSIEGNIQVSDGAYLKITNTNLNIASGTITASGPNTVVELINCANVSNVINNITLLDGAKLILTNSYFESSGLIHASGSNTEIHINSSLHSQLVNINSGKIQIKDGAKLF